MQVFGSTRSRVCKDHALICPDSFVPSPLPGWDKTQGIILIAPAMGARFSQYLAVMEPGAVGGAALPEMERVLFVLEGEARIQLGGNRPRTLTPGAFAYLPPGSRYTLLTDQTARLNVFEKRYSPPPGLPAPEPIIGHEKDVQGTPFLGDPDAVLKVLLPTDPRFDLAVNVFTYQPGATLPQVEIHVMEHGLLMLDGMGVYRLADSWYPVQKGDVIWMAPYCPQWFVAMGKSPARYLYYKDVNRDPLEGSR
jgi:(S)-ureidoglycine aminohydrolase